jgi:hypothetical protein
MQRTHKEKKKLCCPKWLLEIAFPSSSSLSASSTRTIPAAQELGVWIEQIDSLVSDTSGTVDII